MTDDELQAIEARLKAATSGPWTTGAGKVRDGETRELVIAPNDDVIVAMAYGGFGNPTDRTTQDRTFIAHARTDIPALVAEVRRLQDALYLAWSDGWQAAFDRPADAEEAIRFRDLTRLRQVRQIREGVVT